MAWSRKLNIDGVPVAIGHSLIYEMSEVTEWHCATVCLNSVSINALKNKTREEILTTLQWAIAKANAQHERSGEQ